jgi:hypothetical protein
MNRISRPLVRRDLQVAVTSTAVSRHGRLNLSVPSPTAPGPLQTLPSGGQSLSWVTGKRTSPSSGVQIAESVSLMVNVGK